MPPKVRRLVLKSMQRLLPRMALAKHASGVLHPLLRLVDGDSDELRRDAVRPKSPAGTRFQAETTTPSRP